MGAVFSNLRGLPEEVFKFFVPYGFSVMPMFDPTLMFGGLAILAILTFLVIKKGLYKHPVIWLGAAWWIGMLAPSLAYNPSFAGAAAYDYLDHRAYFAMLGFGLILLQLADSYQLFSKKSRNFALAFGAGIWIMGNNYNALNYKDWKSYYQNALNTNTESGLAPLNYGTMLKNEGNFQLAEPYMEQAVRRSPKYADAYVKLAEVQFNLGKYDACLQSANLALGIEPKNGAAYQFRGISYGTKGMYNESLADLNKACEIQPNEPLNFKNRAITYKNMRQWALCIADYTVAIKADSLNASMIQDRGIAYAELNQLPAALADFEAVTRITPENGVAWYFKGRAKITMGNAAQGCADLQKAAQMNVPEAIALLQKTCK